MGEKEDLDAGMRRMLDQIRKLDPVPGPCPGEEVLAAYYEGGLGRKQREEVEEHLILCERCTEELGLLSEMKGSTGREDEDRAPDEMVQRAKDLVKPQPSPVWMSPWEKISGWLSGFGPMPALGAACAALALMVFTLYLYVPGSGNGLPSLAVIAVAPAGGMTRGDSRFKKDTEIREGGVLRSGERFRIRFQVPKGAYVCLLARNSEGRLIRLFPGKAVDSRFWARPGVAYFVPGEKEWFQLDDRTGEEKIFLLASKKPLNHMDGKIHELGDAGVEEIGRIFPEAKIRTFAFRHE